MNTKTEVLFILDDVLSLNGRAKEFDENTALLGVLPELDSMAVVGVLNALEEHFGFIVEDDEVDGTTFATVGTLLTFVEQKVNAVE